MLTCSPWAWELNQYEILKRPVQNYLQILAFSCSALLCSWHVILQPVTRSARTCERSMSHYLRISSLTVDKKKYQVRTALLSRSPSHPMIDTAHPADLGKCPGTVHETLNPLPLNKIQIIFPSSEFRKQCFFHRQTEKPPDRSAASKHISI